MTSSLLAFGADPFITANDGQSARGLAFFSDILEREREEGERGERERREREGGFRLLMGGKPKSTLFMLLKNENQDYLKVCLFFCFFLFLFLFIFVCFYLFINFINFIYSFFFCLFLFVYFLSFYLT